MIRQKMDSLSFELLRFFISRAGLGTCFAGSLARSLSRPISFTRRCVLLVVNGCIKETLFNFLYIFNV